MSLYINREVIVNWNTEELVIKPNDPLKEVVEPLHPNREVIRAADSNRIVTESANYKQTSFNHQSQKGKLLNPYIQSDKP